MNLPHVVALLVAINAHAAIRFPDDAGYVMEFGVYGIEQLAVMPEPSVLALGLGGLVT